MGLPSDETFDEFVTLHTQWRAGGSDMFVEVGLYPVRVFKAIRSRTDEAHDLLCMGHQLFACDLRGE